MVGLSVVLESKNAAAAAASSSSSTAKTVVNKATAVKPPESHPSSSSSSRRSGYLPSGDGFLDACYLCRQKLLPEKDIYMYKGDKAFCSEDCRLKLMAMDGYDEDNNNFNNH